MTRLGTGRLFLIHRVLCLVFYNTPIKHRETNIAEAGAAATPRPSQTHPQLTRPGSDGDDTSLPHTTPSMTSIAGYTTGRTGSATGHPQILPRGGGGDTARASHSLLLLHPEHCTKQCRVTPRVSAAWFILTTVRAGRDVYRSAVKGRARISHDVGKWKPGV